MAKGNVMVLTLTPTLIRGQPKTARAETSTKTEKLLLTEMNTKTKKKRAATK